MDLQLGNGFLVTDPAEFTVDETKKKSLNGPQSPRFGTSYDDEQGFMERWRCECGEFTGKLFEHEICPYCGKPVESRGADVQQTGWIPLRGRKIINPAYYRILSSIIGNTAFTDIIVCKQKIDKDGKRSSLSDEDFENTKPTSPFVGIGITEFYHRFEEIMDYYKRVKKAKVSSIELALQEKGKVFTSFVPIYTTMLRAQSITSESYYFTGIDKQINPLINLAINLEDCAEIDESMILNNIQKRVNAIWEFNFELLNGKDGIFRDQLLGGSVNFSSRNVICPDPTLKTNEIDISYNTAYTLFRLKIIHYLMKLNNISMAEANSIWEAGYNFDEQVYQIMQFIVEKERPMFIINRNPTINYYSMILMKVRNVKRGKDDYTLAVPLSILPGLNADFDGDILNMICILDDLMKHIFRKFDPVKNMIIGKDTGLINEYFNITKNQKIDLYQFAVI